MPTVNKQGGRVSSNESVLGRIVPVSKMDSTGIKILLYGKGKTGKSRIGATFPKPLLIIGTEDGTKSVSDVEGIDFVRLEHSTEIIDLSKMLKSSGKYKSVELDTAGGLQDLILKEVLGLDELPPQKTWGLAQQDHWMAVSMQFKEHLDLLLNLADSKGIHVVVIAHERNFVEEGGTSDIMVPTVGAALTPKLAGWLNTRCDYVTQTFLRQKVREVKTNVEGQVITVKEKVDGVDYCLRVGEHPVFSTGFRLPVGRVLPDVIVNASYGKIAKLIRGEK
jgi:hypothetical protein